MGKAGLRAKRPRRLKSLGKEAGLFEANWQGYTAKGAESLRRTASPLKQNRIKNRRQPFKTVGSGFGAPGGIRTHGLPLRSTAYHFASCSYYNFSCCFFANCVAWRQVNLHKNP